MYGRVRVMMVSRPKVDQMALPVPEIVDVSLSILLALTLV
jgi:hypothetical protein